MDVDHIRSEIARLLDMETPPEDQYELYLVLRNKLNELRAMRMPLPEDLIRFERELEARFAADRKGKTAFTRPQ
jgi:hypothetical protein